MGFALGAWQVFTAINVLLALGLFVASIMALKNKAIAKKLLPLFGIVWGAMAVFGYGRGLFLPDLIR